MKKIFIVLISLILLISCVSCSSQSNDDKKTTSKYTIVCTIFPEYDWVVNLAKGTDFDVILLADSAIDLHNYNPTAKDIVTIGNADIFVYNGGESDEWVDDVLKTVTNKNQLSINVVDSIGDNAITFDDDGEEEIDEHVWLSISNAKLFIEKFTEIVESKYPQYKEIIESNKNNYVAELNNIDEQFKQCKGQHIIIADRNPFAYLSRDYDIALTAAYYGCSAEVEVSFDTIINLAHELDQIEPKAVSNSDINSSELVFTKFIFALDNSDQKIAQQVIDNSEYKNVTILTLNSMQSLTKHDIGKTTYTEIMLKNLEMIKEAN